MIQYAGVDLYVEVPTTQRKTMKTVAYHCGLIITVLGTSLYAVGIFSSHWVCFRTGAAFETSTNFWTPFIPQIRQPKLLSNFGPWRACNYEGECGSLWKFVKEIDQMSAMGIQGILIVSFACYFVGLLALLLQNIKPVRIRKRLMQLNKFPVAELSVPTAAFLGFTAMLLMGELKRTYHPHVNQTSKAGWAFVITLIAIVATIVGNTLTTFHRYKVRDSTLNKHRFDPKSITESPSKMTLHIKKSKGNSDGNPSVVINDSQVKVFLTTSQYHVQPQQTGLRCVTTGSSESPGNNKGEYTQLEGLLRLRATKSTNVETLDSNYSIHQTHKDAFDVQQHKTVDYNATGEVFASTLFHQNDEEHDGATEKVIRFSPSTSAASVGFATRPNMIKLAYEPPHQLTETNSISAVVIK